MYLQTHTEKGPLPLSARLRLGTQKAHRTVESLAFIRSFLRGVVDRESYMRMLIDLYHVYSHLESALAIHAGRQELLLLFSPELRRRAALLSDLEYFCDGQHWPPPTPSRAAISYGEYLRRLAQEQPVLLFSHAYTRYLGDLSGGQVLRRIAARALGLSGQQGLLFYEFPEIADIPAWKAQFRARLDAMPLTESAKEHIVFEAQHAFMLNGAVYAELSGSAWSGFWSMFHWGGRRSAS